jgi:hypothetical protein
VIQASVCQNCGASVRLPATVCWMCRAPLVAVAPTSAERPRDYTSAALGLVTVVLVSLVLSAIFTALVFEAPGLAIPFAVLAIPLVGGLAAVAFAVHVRGKAPVAGAALTQRGDTRGNTESWLDSAAKAMVIVIAILVGMAALGMTALVILFTICFALLASSGMH